MSTAAAYCPLILTRLHTLSQDTRALDAAAWHTRSIGIIHVAQSASDANALL